MVIVSVHLLHSQTTVSVHLPVILLHLLRVHSLHWVHQMKFLPVPFLLIEQSHFPKGVSNMSAVLLFSILAIKSKAL